MKQDLNELAQEIHAEMIKWWQDMHTQKPIERNRYELIALAVSEVAECLEGERKNLMDDKLPHRKMAEVEMADAVIRLLDYAAGFGHTIKPILYLDTITIADNKAEALGRLMFAIINIVERAPWWLDYSLCYIELYCQKHGYDLEGAMTEKREYNKTRSDHSHEARRIAGGKQF